MGVRFKQGDCVQVVIPPDGFLHTRTTGQLTEYGKRWHKKILPAIQKNAERASKRVLKRFGKRGEHFNPEMRRTAYHVLEWLLETDQHSLPPKVLRAEVNSALDYLEAWKNRTNALEEALSECSTIVHNVGVNRGASAEKVAGLVDYVIEEVMGKSALWPTCIEKEVEEEEYYGLREKRPTPAATSQARSA